MDYILKLQKANEANFAEYGMYIGGPNRAADHSENAFDWWNGLAKLDFGATASLGIVRAKYTGNFSQNIFEQHAHSIEVLIPLDNDIVIVVGKPCALNGDTCNHEDFAAFLVPKHSIVVLNKGVWHRAPMTFSDTANVLVLFKDNTSANDTKLIELSDVNFNVML